MGLPGLCRGCSCQKEILGIRLSPKSGDVRGLEMVAYVVAQGSETSPCPGHSPLSPVILEEALPAELVLEKGTVLVKAGFSRMAIKQVMYILTEVYLAG